jgi:hypothetical protein
MKELNGPRSIFHSILLLYQLSTQIDDRAVKLGKDNVSAYSNKLIIMCLNVKGLKSYFYTIPIYYSLMSSIYPKSL